MEWVDPEWPAPLKMSLARIWGMYDEENSLRLRQNVDNAKDVVKIKGEKEKVEKDLRFFKVDFANMVYEKERALTQLGNTHLAHQDLKREMRTGAFLTNLPQTSIMWTELSQRKRET